MLKDTTLIQKPWQQAPTRLSALNHSSSSREMEWCYLILRGPYQGRWIKSQEFWLSPEHNENPKSFYRSILLQLFQSTIFPLDDNGELADHPKENSVSCFLLFSILICRIRRSIFEFNALRCTSGVWAPAVGVLPLACRRHEHNKRSESEDQKASEKRRYSQYSSEWGGSSGRALCRGSGPRSRPPLAAPRCCNRSLPCVCGAVRRPSAAGGCCWK